MINKILKLSPDQNTMTDADGIVYKAVDTIVKGSCQGCFFHETHGCNRPHVENKQLALLCSSERKDGREIIWVLEQEAAS